MKLPKEDVRLISRYLQHRSRSLDELLSWLQLNQYIIEKSQQDVCGIFGYCDIVPIYRLVVVEDLSKLRKESIIASSINFNTIIEFARQATYLYEHKMSWSGKIHGGGTIVILRYDIPIQNILAYIPTLIDYILVNYSEDELRKIRPDNKERKGPSINQIIYHQINTRQEEIIADVSNINYSKIMDIEIEHGGWDKDVINIIQLFLNGYNTSESILKVLEKRSSSWQTETYTPPWSGPIEIIKNEKRRQEYLDIIQSIIDEVIDFIS